MSDQNPLGKSLELLWEGLPGSEKGPRPKLTLEQVVQTGIDLADAEGLEALSMRKLAQRLGVGTMSLYRYVPAKKELLDLMLDAIVGPSQERLEAAENGWREFLTTTARQARRLYLEHPWMLQANWSRPVLGPNSVADLELTMKGIADARLSDQAKMNAVTSVESFVMGSARQELLWANAATEQGITDEEFWASQLPTLIRAMESGKYPVMAELDEDIFDATWDDGFEFGLQLILDGIDARQEPPAG